MHMFREKTYVLDLSGKTVYLRTQSLRSCRQTFLPTSMLQCCAMDGGISLLCLQGVMIPQTMMLACMRGMTGHIEQLKYEHQLNEQDVFLSFLPLAHIFGMQTSLAPALQIEHLLLRVVRHHLI